MKLMERERLLIAQRAAGSYAIIPNVQRIITEHRKNRNPDDAPFLEFARLALKKSYERDDYERLARAVLAIIPHPHGIPSHLKDPDPEPAGTVEPPKETKRKKRVIKCGICGGEGHNARTCPNKPDTPTVTHTDGLERLSPGFDPNPPERVEEDSD